MVVTMMVSWLSSTAGDTDSASSMSSTATSPNSVRSSSCNSAPGVRKARRVWLRMASVGTSHRVRLCSTGARLRLTRAMAWPPIRVLPPPVGTRRQTTGVSLASKAGGA